MMFRKVGIICGAIAMAAALHAMQPSQNTPASSPQTQQNAATEQMRKMWPNLTPNQNPVAVAKGKILFASNCGFCHGADASGGNGGPDLIRSVLVNHDEHGDLIGPTIRNGRPDKGMPPFTSFTSAQIENLVAFIHQQNRDARIRFSYKIGNVAVGNAASGKDYFQTHCAQCHSPTGDLAGIATKFAPDALQQLWLNPASLIAADRTVTVTLPSRQKFSGKLQYMDEFNVALYDADGYHSFPIEPGTIVEVQNPMTAHRQLLQHLTDTDMHNVTTYLVTLK